MRAAFCDGIMAFSGIIGTIRGDAADLLVRRDLTEQIGQDWRVADMACGDLDGPNLQRFLVEFRGGSCASRARVSPLVRETVAKAVWGRRACWRAIRLRPPP